jgi:hypothetical protein
MKVYLFNTETGAYLGEDFSSGMSVSEDEGETTVGPPPYGSGEVPVFDRAGFRWRLLSVEQFQAMARNRS